MTFLRPVRPKLIRAEDNGDRDREQRNSTAAGRPLCEFWIGLQFVVELCRAAQLVAGPHGIDGRLAVALGDVR